MNNDTNLINSIFKHIFHLLLNNRNKWIDSEILGRKGLLYNYGDYQIHVDTYEDMTADNIQCKKYRMEIYIICGNIRNVLCCHETDVYIYEWFMRESNIYSIYENYKRDFYHMYHLIPYDNVEEEWIHYYNTEMGLNIVREFHKYLRSNKIDILLL